MRTDEYLGVLLSSITQLSYSTFVQKAGSKRDVPLLVLLVDIDDDGIEDYHFLLTPGSKTRRIPPAYLQTLDGISQRK